MSLPLEQVRSNINELLLAGKGSTPRITSDLKGSSIVSGISVFWLFYRVIYIVIDLFSKEKLEPKNLAKAIKKTDEAFAAHVAALKISCDNYFKYLNQRLIQPETPLTKEQEIEINQAKRNITQWNKQMGKILTISPEKIDQLMKKVALVNPKAFQNRTTSAYELLLYSKAIADAAIIQQVINLEHYTQEPIPFAALINLSFEKRKVLSKKVQNQMDSWVANLNELNTIVPVIRIRDLDAGLKALTSMFKLDGPFKPPSLSLLEWELKKTCKVFDQVDAQFIKLRKDLETGKQSKVYCNGKELVVVSHLGVKPMTKKDKFVLFKLASPMDQHAIIIGRNCTDIKTKWVEAERNEAKEPIPMLEPTEIDQDGLLAIVEKVVPISIGYQWQSNSENISEADKIKAKKIIAIVQKMKSLQRIPEKFSLDSLMVDKDGYLKSMQFLKWRDIDSKSDFLKVASLIEHCAGSNRYLFRYMAHKSLHHPIYENFFFSCVKKKLDGDTTSVEEIGAKEADPITDQIVLERAKKIQGDMIFLRTEILKKMMNYPFASDLDIPEKISSLILEKYKNYYLFLRADQPLWIVDQVVNEILHSKSIV